MQRPGSPASNNRAGRLRCALHREFRQTGHSKSVDWCATVKLDPAPRFEPGKSFVGSSNGYGEMDPLDQRKGWVTAIYADSGSIRWRYRTATPMLAAILLTASDLW